MTQAPCKHQSSSEPSLPDWLGFLKPPPAEEDPFHVKGPSLFLLGDKQKEPHVITGTHHHGNLKYIGETNQTLVKDTSRLVKPTTMQGVEESSLSSRHDSTKKPVDETSPPDGTWSLWLIVLVALWLFSLSLSKSSPQDWIQSPILSPTPIPSSQRDESATPTTTTNLPIPKRIATIILQELSPFPSPSDPDMTPIIDVPWKGSGLTDRAEFPIVNDDADLVKSIEEKRPVSEDLTVRVKDSVQQVDNSHLEPSTIDVCGHSWQWILHRSCRVQRRNQGTTTTPNIHDHDRGTSTASPTTIEPSSIEPCHNWFSRDCRVQKRAWTGRSSSTNTGSDDQNAKGTTGTWESHPNSPSKLMFKEQTIKAVQSLLEAAYQTHKLVNLWIQEELETTNLVEPTHNQGDL